LSDIRRSQRLGCGPAAAFDQHGIAEFVGEIAGVFQRRARPAQDVVVGEGPKQLVVAGARLVRAADDGIGHAQPGARPDALIGKAGARAKRAARCGVFQRPGHRGAQRDHPCAAGLGSGDRPHRRQRDPVRLIERQTRIQFSITGG
jgi:hypothetical protein